MNASRQNIIVALYKLLISILIFNSFNCQNIDDDQVENNYYPEKVLEFANFPKCCPLDQVSHRNIFLRINPDLHNMYYLLNISLFRVSKFWNLFS